MDIADSDSLESVGCWGRQTQMGALGGAWDTLTRPRAHTPINPLLRDGMADMDGIAIVRLDCFFFVFDSSFGVFPFKISMRNSKANRHMCTHGVLIAS